MLGMQKPFCDRAAIQLAHPASFLVLTYNDAFHVEVKQSSLSLGVRLLGHVEWVFEASCAKLIQSKPMPAAHCLGENTQKAHTTLP